MHGWKWIILIIGKGLFPYALYKVTGQSNVVHLPAGEGTLWFELFSHFHIPSEWQNCFKEMLLQNHFCASWKCFHGSMQMANTGNHEKVHFSKSVIFRCRGLMKNVLFQKYSNSKVQKSYSEVKLRSNVKNALNSKSDLFRKSVEKRSKTNGKLLFSMQKHWKTVTPSDVFCGTSKNATIQI